MGLAFAGCEQVGSSPRGRGKRCRRRALLGPRRLIPARAGKTRHWCDALEGVAAHPRAGGENEAGDEKGATFEGSSPRGRGKLSGAGLGCPGPGLIPARAGKTPTPTR